MSTEDSQSTDTHEGSTSVTRRDVLKGFAATTVAAASAGMSIQALAADQASSATEVKNPYGAPPGSGV